MITLTDFTAINDEIKSAINSTLDEIKNSSQMNYVLYLANGDYRSEHDNLNSTLNPNVIDYQGDLHRDETRLNFLGNFLKTFYSFPIVKLTCWSKLLSIFNSSLRKSINEERRVNDDELRISLELMVYSHTWESDNFLKDLYRLAKLVDTGTYAFALSGIAMIEKIVHEGTLYGLLISCAIAAACELWSISANMLIVKPDMPFLKIFRLQLKGEIENKLGKNFSVFFKDKNNEPE
jgi:hypothetical protein